MVDDLTADYHLSGGYPNHIWQYEILIIHMCVQKERSKQPEEWGYGAYFLCVYAFP